MSRNGSLRHTGPDMGPQKLNAAPATTCSIRLESIQALPREGFPLGADYAVEWTVFR